MKVTENADLAAFNSFGVPARAALQIAIETEEDVLNCPTFDLKTDLVLGDGSNVLLVTDVPGTVYLNRIGGVELIRQDADHVWIDVGAGENWHRLVLSAIEQGWHGLENLALIPGLAGAAPIQNIGAYGAELSSVLESVTAWDWQAAQWTVLDKEACQFEYRDSVFKSGQPNRYLITSIRLRLARRYSANLSYAALAAALVEKGLGEPNAVDVSEMVIRLRQSRLPDPATIGNAGSFFKNPVIDHARLEELLRYSSQAPHWPAGKHQVKLAAAWLIEQCDLKGLRHGGAAVSEQHALVLVNLDSASGTEIWQLAKLVQQRVEDKFGIRLEPEPRIYRPTDHATPTKARQT